MPVNETITSEERRFRGEIPENSLHPVSRVGDRIPELLTKKWLCCRFEIPSTNTARLYRFVLTVEVLQEVGLSPDEVRQRGFKTFNAIQSKRLTQILFG